MAVTLVIGGKGNQSAAASSNGGAWDDSGAMTWALMQGANGGPKNAIVSGATASDNGSGKVRLTSNGDFQTGLTDIYAYCTGWTAVYNAGRYKVIASTADYVDLDLAYQAPGNGEPTCDIVVGGALGADGSAEFSYAFQVAFDCLATAGDSIKVACDGSTTYTLSGTSADVDGVAGTAAARMTIEGVDPDGVRLTAADVLPIITTETDMVGASGGMFEVSGATTYYDWRMLDMDGGGNGKAEHCIYCDDGNSDHHRFFNVKMHNTEDEALYWGGHYALWRCCEVYQADQAAGSNVPGAYITSSSCKILGCSFHDNAEAGLQVDKWNAEVLNSLFYANGGNGLEMESTCYHSSIANNTVWGNGGVGVFIDTGAYGSNCFNNTSSGNTGDNWDLDNDIDHFAYFAHNHSFGGSGALVADGMTWATLGEGNNITGDPLFKSTADGQEDFTPRYNSPLLGNGAPEHLAIAGDLNHLTCFNNIGAITPERKSFSRRTRYGAKV